MTPHRPSARRLLAGGTLFAALGVLGAASAAPATADATPLVWGHAQSWVADGDLVTGYSTVVGFGGDTEENVRAETLFGPLAEHALVRGGSSAVVDGDGASARSTVDSAIVRLGVHDLAALGLLDLPDGAAPPSASPSAPESPPPVTASESDSDSDAASDPERDPGTERSPGTQDGTGDDADGPVIAEESGPEPEAPEEETLREPSSSPSAESASPSASPSDGTGTASPASTGDDVVVLDESNSRTASGSDNSVEFTLADVTGTADADFDGSTEASLEHGDLTAFGVPVGPVDAEGVTVDDTLEVLGEDGEVLETVPVSVRFEATEATFDDQDEDWTGEGVRTALTVWIQVGDDEEDVLGVDFADAWALGSTFGDAVGAPGPTDRSADPSPSPSPSTTPAATDNRLATTGSSLAALVTAAVVAVGGGAAATFLARKRTTALDDQIED
ncbi:hypothetical protein [Nocardiopsis aegyptia]|uniref:Htaa domain-containing protein n=1 Tax=Nocardiopsis aegyptia TaxID=220378 RepID=A0A7Z0EQ89_9ACTN|nr:hypothetical protein [Nocardiopsis aegyptia]NYJ35721.1 hypothetical protein [Nocardiopsis aegyptia]